MPLAKSDIVAQFQKRFGQSPQWVIRTPNRVNRSLRNDYEVSSDALKAMVESAAAHPARYGVRMTGAGFGGCAIALIRADSAGDFAAKTMAAYQEKTGHVPAVYVCQATNGAEAV